jgi:hypothetical protein
LSTEESLVPSGREITGSPGSTGEGVLVDSPPDGAVGDAVGIVTDATEAVMVLSFVVGSPVATPVGFLGLDLQVDPLVLGDVPFAYGGTMVEGMEGVEVTASDVVEDKLAIEVTAGAKVVAVDELPAASVGVGVDPSVPEYNTGPGTS